VNMHASPFTLFEKGPVMRRSLPIAFHQGHGIYSASAVRVGARKPQRFAFLSRGDSSDSRRAAGVKLDFFELTPPIPATKEGQRMRSSIRTPRGQLGAHDVLRPGQQFSQSLHPLQLTVHRGRVKT
jgi:hypothetical protein